MGDSAKDIYFSEKLDERTFKYEFLLRIPLGITFQKSKNVQNLILSKFQDEF